MRLDIIEQMLLLDRTSMNSRAIMLVAIMIRPNSGRRRVAV